jgi:hypothetical protein
MFLYCSVCFLVMVYWFLLSMFLSGDALRRRRRWLDAAGRLSAHILDVWPTAMPNHCQFCRRQLRSKWQTLELEPILQTNHATADTVLHIANEMREKPGQVHT